MSVFEIIKSKYECDVPIFISDIESIFPERSRPWIDKAIKDMIDEKKLKRFSTGVYYIPRKTFFGESILNPQTVIEKKYIKNETETFGYASGLSLLNDFGLTTQVPNVITVTSNNESSRGRNIHIGKQPVYVMSSCTKVTKENCATLKLLEVAKLIDFNDLDETEKHNIEKFVFENKITLSMVSAYCKYFPDYVSKRILGGNIIQSLARQ